MTKPKTQKNDASVDQFLAGIKDDQQRTDCLAVLELMKELTGEPAVMWGKAKVGFGSFHYRGKTSEGDWFHVGFSPRKQDLVLYLHCELCLRHTGCEQPVPPCEVYFPAMNFN